LKKKKCVVLRSKRHVRRYCDFDGDGSETGDRAVECRRQMWCGIDDPRRVVDVLFVVKFTQKQHG